MLGGAPSPLDGQARDCRSPARLSPTVSSHVRSQTSSRRSHPLAGADAQLAASGVPWLSRTFHRRRDRASRSSNSSSIAPGTCCRWPRLPLYFAWDAYRAHAERLGRQDRRLDAVARSTTASASSTTASGSSAVERFAGAVFSSVRGRCGRATLAEAVPALAHSALPAAYTKRSPRAGADAGAVSRSRGRPPSPAERDHSSRRRGACCSCGAMSPRRLRSMTPCASMPRVLRSWREGANDGIWELDEGSRTRLRVSAAAARSSGCRTAEGPRDARQLVRAGAPRRSRRFEENLRERHAGGAPSAPDASTACGTRTARIAAC